MKPVITSRENLLVKYLKELREKSSFRREERAFIVEGVSLSEEALYADCLQKLVVAEGHERRHEIERLEKAANSRKLEVVRLSAALMKVVSSLTTPPGVMAIAKMPVWSEEEVLKSRRPLLLLCGLQDPGNMGTIIRTVEAAGAGGVFCAPGSVDPYNPKVVRGCMGSILRVPVIEVDDTPALLRRISAVSYTVLATGAGAKETCFDSDLKPPFLLLVGREASGVPDDMLSSVDRTISIPMEGKVESLNAAMAAGIILFEAKRQRAEVR